jgi:hypothetical protein
MGCKICVLIIPGSKDFGSEVIHFHEEKATILPVAPHLYSDTAIGLNPFIEFVATSANVRSALNNSGAVLFPDDDDEDPYYGDYSGLAELIIAADPENFILQYYTEIGDHPDDHIFLTVANGNVVHKATNYYDKNDKDNHIATYPFLVSMEKEFGLNGPWLVNESRYFSFERAKSAFYKV